jgi:NTE family protein
MNKIKYTFIRLSINNNNKKHIQRALVLQGGGALGAYEVGALKVLCKHLTEQDKENGEEGKILFDIVAGTSIGATNGAILISQFLNTKSWEKAAEKLEQFWTKQLSLKCLDLSDVNKVWYNEWIKRNPTAASEEAARRYYSVYKLLSGTVRNNMYYVCSPIKDKKFFDYLPLSTWNIHSSKPLQESIEKYAEFPIATEFSNNGGSLLQQQQQPRLLVFSVDVAEGETITFDSYPKADGSRISKYGKDNKIVIDYNDGITIDQVMASNTLPEFYDYAPIGIDSKVDIKDQDESCRADITDKEKTRYFWDGGLLSNMPFRELLEAHQEYWESVKPNEKIPDLEVYIINVHPSKMDKDILPHDYDGIKDRKNDILYHDRNSHYDENISYILTDYNDFVRQMRNLLEDVLNKFDDKKIKDEYNEKLKHILAIKTISKNKREESREYKHLLKPRFKLNKVIRIERSNYKNNISGKIGDLSLETINKLIKEGEYDAWFSLIKEFVKEMNLVNPQNHPYNMQNKLTNKLDTALSLLKKNDYKDSDSHVYRHIKEFIDMVKDQHNKLEEHQSSKLIKLAEVLRDKL